MTAVELVLVLAAIASVVLVTLLCVQIVMLRRATTEVVAIATDLRDRTGRLVSELEVVMGSTERDAQRLDEMLTAAESMNELVESLTETARERVATPVIKARAFMAGTGRAAKKLSSGS